MQTVSDLIAELRPAPPAARGPLLSTWYEEGGDELLDELSFDDVPGQTLWVEAMELAAEAPPSKGAARLMRDWLRSRMRYFTSTLSEGQVSALEWRMLALQVRVEWVGPHRQNALMAAAWLQQGPLADAVPEVTGSAAFQRFVGAAPLHHGWHASGGVPVPDIPVGSGTHNHRLASVSAMRDGTGQLLSAQALTVGGGVEFTLCGPDLAGLAVALGRTEAALTGGPFASGHADVDTAFGAVLARVRAPRVAELTTGFVAAVRQSVQTNDSDRMRGIFAHADDHLRLAQAIFQRSLAGTHVTNDAWLACVNALLEGHATVDWERDSFGANPLGADGIVFQIGAEGRGFLYLFDAAGRCGQTPMGPR